MSHQRGNSMPLICSQCGTQNPDSAFNCFSCGNQLSRVDLGKGGSSGGYGQSQGQQPPYGSAPGGAYGNQPSSNPNPYGGTPAGGYGASPDPYGGSPQSPYGQQPPSYQSPYSTPQTPGYGQSPGYGQTPGYGQAPGYGQSPNYGQYGSAQTPGFLSQLGYGNRQPGNPWKRLIANIVDQIIINLGGIPGMLLVMIGGASEAEAVIALGMLVAFAGIILVAIWEIYLLGSRGVTPGKKLMNLICLKDDGQVAGFWLAFGRELLKQVFGSFCFLNLWLLFDPEKKQLYDKILNMHVYDNN